MPCERFASVGLGTQREYREAADLPPPYHLAPWGPGTIVEWSDHGDVQWDGRCEEVGAAKAEIEAMAVTQRIRPDRQDPKDEYRVR